MAAGRIRGETRAILADGRQYQFAAADDGKHGIEYRRGADAYQFEAGDWLCCVGCDDRPNVGDAFNGLGCGAPRGAWNVVSGWLYSPAVSRLPLYVNPGQTLNLRLVTPLLPVTANASITWAEVGMP